MEVAAGSLTPQNPIKVTTAPFALRGGISLPTVSVHLEQTGPQDGVLGEEQCSSLPTLSRAEWSKTWNVQPQIIRVIRMLAGEPVIRLIDPSHSQVARCRMSNSQTAYRGRNRGPKAANALSARV